MIIGFDAKRAFHNTSGLGNYSRDIIRILSSQFPEHEYLLYNPRNASKEPWIGEKANVSIKYPDRWLWKRFSSIWRQGPISGQIARDGVNIFHGLSNEIPRGINRVRTRVIVTIHDLLFLRYPEFYKPVDRKIYYNKVSYAAKNADTVIAISEQTKRDIVRFLKLDENRITVHYQGCHAAFKQTYGEAEKEFVRKKFSLPERYLLTVGTIERRKNALILLKAIKDMDVHLVLIGRDTTYKDELTNYIHENGMTDRVHFPKGVGMNDLAMIYQMAELFCYPSVFEGFGIPIIEALYSKTPVITTAGGCFAEAGGEGSVYLPSDDPSAWTEAIRYLLSEPEKRRLMAESGWNYAQRFNDENVGTKLMEIYKKTLG